MATVFCRVLFVVRRFEVSRMLNVTSTVMTTKNYRNETWCKSWGHIPQRNLFLATSCFAPSLSPILAKEVDNSKSGTVSKNLIPSKLSQDDKAPKSSDVQNAVNTVADVTVTYHRGLPKIMVPLPSRQEKCLFTLKPTTHTVGDFLRLLKREDRGIDRAIVTTIDGIRIGSSNTVESLLEDDFRLIINNNEYLVQPPLHQRQTMDDSQKLSYSRMLVGQLYNELNVSEFRVNMEKEILAELEEIRLELEPLEQKFQELETAAARRASIFIWASLVLMSAQFSGLARLTWWEYSWDIMEPVTYFVTYGTSMAWFVYFVLTKEEYMLSDVFNRRCLISLHKRAKKMGLDLNLYNSLKDRAYELETTLKIIRGPLYNYQTRMEQKKRERSSSSSSSSRSPSSSPSPSPSPERSLPKKGIFPEKDTSKKPVNENRKNHKETWDY